MKLYCIDVSVCYLEFIYLVGSYLYENNRDVDCYLIEYVVCFKIMLDVCLNYEEVDCFLENDFKGVEYCIGFEIMLFFEKFEVFGEYLIKDDDKRFGFLFLLV